jgi:hypothetical protein
VPGRGHGPDAEQVSKLRKLHARTLRQQAPKRSRSARRSGSSGSPPAARRTRD